VVGIFTTGNSFGDSGAMFPLPVIQGYNRVPGQMTLFFVKVEPGQPVVKVQNAIDQTYPGMTTIRTAEQFGRADTNLVFLRAAVTSSTVLAIIIGAVIIGNTMLLSLFERTREFGLLRAIGWARTRVVGLVVGEGIILALIGSCLGLALAVVAVALLKYVPALRGILHPTFDQSAFARGLATGLGMAVIGALYPALRASSLKPLEALSRE
jgi:putative ABC transport system permease protein